MSFSRSGNTSGKTPAAPPSSSIPRPPPPNQPRRGSTTTGAAAAPTATTNTNSTTSGNTTPRREPTTTTTGVSSRLYQPTASSSIRSSSNRGAVAGRRGSRHNNTNAHNNNSRDNSDNDDDENNSNNGPTWICVSHQDKPCSLFAAPNGPQVGEAEAGTTVEEYSKMIDMFGAEWIASIAVDERKEREKAISGSSSPPKAVASGRRKNTTTSGNADQNDNEESSEQQQVSYIWFRRYEKGDSLQSKRAPLWELRTKEHANSSNTNNAAGESTTSSSSSAAVAVCSPSNAPFRTTNQMQSQTVTDYSLILQYLEKNQHKVPVFPNRDWNSEYQFLIEKLMFDESAKENTDDVRLSIHKFYSEFAEEIGKAGSKIVEELSSSVSSEKTIKPFYGTGGSVVLGTYFHNGIMYRMNVDSAGGFYGGDKNAMKIAHQNLKANNFVATAGPLFFFHQPLVMVMNYRGFRITASTIPPLRADALLAGSLDQGKTWQQPTGFFNTLLDEFGEQLGLAKHKVKALDELATSSATNATSHSTHLPFDSCIVGGFDQRFYTMNVGRFLPPLIPLKNHPQYQQAGVASSLFWRLRPELVNRLDFQVSPDAFVPHASHIEDNEEAISASTLLRDHAIPSVAAVLGFLEPTLAPTLTLEECASCKKKDIQSHLVFSICESDCCRICPQCYLEIQKTGFWEGKIEEAETIVKNLITATKCSSLPRTLKGFTMTPDISTIMHAHGVNLRYMNMVCQKIPRSAFHCTAHYLEIEMIARTAQNLLSEILRKAADTEEANQRTAQFFVSLLQNTGDKAERFWAEELGPQLMKQYDVSAPFDTEFLDRDLVYRRVSELTGVSFSPASVKSMLSDKPFIQMLPPQPVLKQVLLPNLVEECGERKEYLDKYSGLLGVYWSELPYKSGADEEFWNKKIPLHFRDE